jgi:hypothetical protein
MMETDVRMRATAGGEYVTYRMDDGTVVKTEKSTVVDELVNRLGERETLYQSRLGRYWIERVFAQTPSEADHAEWLSKRAASRWLLAKGNPLGERVLREALASEGKL